MPARREISRSVLLAAQPRTVWCALTDPLLRRRWLGLDLEVEAAPGARGRAVAAGGDPRPVVVDVAEAGRFSFVWAAPAGSPHGPSRVEIVVAEEGGGTRLTVTETALADLAPAQRKVATRR